MIRFVLNGISLIVFAAVAVLIPVITPAAGDGDFRGLLNRGRLAIEAAEFDIAVKILDRAVSLRPGSADAHLQLARAHAGRKQLKPAGVHFNKTLSLRPGDLEAGMAGPSERWRLSWPGPADTRKPSAA